MMLEEFNINKEGKYGRRLERGKIVYFVRTPCGLIGEWVIRFGNVLFIPAILGSLPVLEQARHISVAEPFA